jgi:transcriptional regulator with XRE-family HTH domain
MFIEMNIEIIGRFLGARRRELGISQQDLSEISGVSLHTLSDVESGSGNPTVKTLSLLLDPLGLELEVRVRRRA